MTGWPITDVSARLARTTLSCARRACWRCDDAAGARGRRALERRARRGMTAIRTPWSRAATRSDARCCARSSAARWARRRTGSRCAKGCTESRRLAGRGGHGRSGSASPTARTCCSSRSAEPADVGIDVERSRSIEQWERVADRVLSTERSAPSSPARWRRARMPARLPAPLVPGGGRAQGDRLRHRRAGGPSSRQAAARPSARSTSTTCRCPPR